MRKFYIYLSLFCCFCSAYAQPAEVNVQIKDIPNEKVYVHSSGTMLLVGEYLYYSIYCLNAKTNNPSEISKTAYVELISSEGEMVNRQVVDLKQGIGNADYFIPTSVGSGNYKLVAYTSWMKNNESNRIFEQDIFIINPYTSAQDKIRKDSISSETNKSKVQSYSSINLAKKEYSSREAVRIDIASFGLDAGNYSISVRKFDEIPSPEITSANNFVNSEFDYQYSSSSKTEPVLPDLRGKLIRGKIEPKISGIPIKNIQVSLSVPGDNYFLRTANTDAKGQFYFSVDENFNNADGIIQVFGKNRDKYAIEISEPHFTDAKDLSFADYGITAAMKQNIIERSVHNQIENAYFSLKPDTIKTPSPDNLFDGVEKVEYKLDDYRRFKTIQETFVEIIPYGRIRKNDGKYEISVLGYEPDLNFDGTPLLIVDGLPVQEVDDFVRNYDSRKIDKISIIRSKYYLGSMLYKGIILVQTITNNFTENYNYDYLKDIKFSSGVSKKRYYKQDYSRNRFPNVPDFRTQLLWDPNFDFSNEKQDLIFYTSDVKGEFEIVIQGFQNNGEPVSIRQSFRVK